MDPTTQRLMMASDIKQPFYGSLTYSASANFNPTDFKLDSNNNAYSVSSQSVLIKLRYGISGANVEWARSITTVSNYSYNAVAVSDDNASIYAVGAINNLAGIVKYNSSGTLQWSRTFSGTNLFFSVTVDSSGDVYAIGYAIRSGQTTNDIILVKYNSSGTLQWQKYVGGTNDEFGYSIKSLPSSGGFVISGISNQQSGTVAEIYVAKFNTLGQLSWQKEISTVTGNESGESVGVDSVGDVYVLGYTDGQGAGSNDTYLAKLSGSTGSISWQRSLGSTSSETGKDLYVDPSTGDCYLLSETVSLILISKYNSSGTLQWQRSMSVTSIFGYSAAGVVLGSDKMLYVQFRRQNSSTGSFVRIDPNGNGTGTFGSHTYSTTSLTDSARTLTLQTPVHTVADTAFTSSDASGVITESNAIASVTFSGS